MKTAVVYFSRTGNTKRLAQAIADVAGASLCDMVSTVADSLGDFDLLILGTPVEGASPAKETREFIEELPAVSGKKVILFCTYRLFGNIRTMKAIEKVLSAKGYETVLHLSKKGIKPQQQADFTEVLIEIKKTLENLK